MDNRQLFIYIYSQLLIILVILLLVIYSRAEMLEDKFEQLSKKVQNKEIVVIHEERPGIDVGKK